MLNPERPLVKGLRSAAVEIHPDHEVLRAHQAHGGVVGAPAQDPHALVRVVVGQDVGGPGVPAPLHLHAHARIGLDVLDVRGRPAVLGHDPESVAAQPVPHRRHALLAALSTRCLEQRHLAADEAALRQPPHDRVRELDGDERAEPALGRPGHQAMRVSSRPSPCASIATLSPGSRKRSPSSGPSSSRQPPLSVPEPSTSPARRRVSRAAWATISGHGKCCSPAWHTDSSSPFTCTRASMFKRPSAYCSSSGVTSQGPRLVAKSLAFDGPRPTLISPAWTSRALQSFISVKPAIWPSPPITAAISSSKSSIFVDSGRRTCAPGPQIEAGFEK